MMIGPRDLNRTTTPWQLCKASGSGLRQLRDDRDMRPGYLDHDVQRALVQGRKKSAAEGTMCGLDVRERAAEMGW